MERGSVVDAQVEYLTQDTCPYIMMGPAFPLNPPGIGASQKIRKNEYIESWNRLNRNRIKADQIKLIDDLMNGR